VAPEGSGKLLAKHGFEVRELSAGGRLELAPGASVLAVDAAHDSGRMPLGAKADPLGYVLDAGGARIYFAGDTDLFDEMDDLSGLDLALIPVWGWGPKLGEGHLDPERAAAAVARLRPRLAVPIHWGTFFPIGRRDRAGRLTDPPHEFARAAATAAPGVEVRVIEALGWGALAASSLVIGAALGLARDWPDRLVGLVLGFGAGALISAVSFELALEGIEEGGAAAAGVGLALGALTYFFLSRKIQGLALGAFLDGVPEQLVLGIGIATGNGVSVGLLTAVFVSNLPEAIGSVDEMRSTRRSSAQIMRMWIVIAVVCALASVLGWVLADNIGGRVGGAINGFAAGALLVMLTDAMIPDAHRQAGQTAGLVVVLGFAVATALSQVSWTE
jgi:zinc transporter, ZIP family